MRRFHGTNVLSGTIDRQLTNINRLWLHPLLYFDSVFPRRTSPSPLWIEPQLEAGRFGFNELKRLYSMEISAKVTTWHNIRANRFGIVFQKFIRMTALRMHFSPRYRLAAGHDAL